MLGTSIPAPSLLYPCSTPAPFLFQSFFFPALPLLHPCSIPAPSLPHLSSTPFAPLFHPLRSIPASPLFHLCSIPASPLLYPCSIPAPPLLHSCSTPVQSPLHPYSTMLHSCSIPAPSLLHFCSTLLHPCSIPSWVHGSHPRKVDFLTQNLLYCKTAEESKNQNWNFEDKKFRMNQNVDSRAVLPGWGLGDLRGEASLFLVSTARSCED